MFNDIIILKITYSRFGMYSSARGRILKISPRIIKIKLPRFHMFFASFATCHCHWDCFIMSNSCCGILLQAELSPHQFTSTVNSVTLFAMSNGSGTFAFTYWLIMKDMKPLMIRTMPKTIGSNIMSHIMHYETINNNDRFRIENLKLKNIL